MNKNVNFHVFIMAKISDKLNYFLAIILGSAIPSGLIAQELKQTMDAMGVDFGGYQDHTINGGEDVLSIGYEEMIAPLIKAIQELKAEFDAYKATHP